MYILENDILSYQLDEMGRVVSIFNKRTGHEYCKAIGELFRLLYKIEDFEERPVNAADQKPHSITVTDGQMRVRYEGLNSPDGVLDVILEFVLTLEGEALSVVSHITNNDDNIEVMELQTTAIAGIGSLGDSTLTDTLVTPLSLGDKIVDPYHADLFKHCSNLHKRKFDRPDYRHMDLDLPYPGFCCMHWFALYNDNESIYVGNHDGKHRMICMHTERRATDNTLRMGICQYPFLKKGESYVTPPIVYGFLKGDWHSCAKMYRKWMDEDYGWKAPERPQWAQEFEGWLRCIFRTQSGEFNYHFSDIPRMFDQVQAAGLNTLFVLGWPKGGFGRMRPDYVLDERYAEDFKKGVEYVHSKGGKLFMYISYHALDESSDFFRECGIEPISRDLWGRISCYSETYGADGSYRKLMNLPRPQYCTCSGSDIWHQKMKESADYCLAQGADGVLYDLGGTRPLFCIAEGHDHKKPNEARSSKATRYKDLRANIKAKGEDRIMMQEHCVDIYAQHMDIIQPSTCHIRSSRSAEVFRYTFPEIRMTNRNNALDETKYKDAINNTYIYGLAFDLSIFRCFGLPNDIPNYTAYMREVISLRKKYSKFFHYGKFVDEDGFTCDKNIFMNKGYVAEDGTLGVAVWNWSDHTDTVTYTNTATGKTESITLDKDAVGFVEL